MTKHSRSVCAEHSIHSKYNTNESAAILIASAAPMMLIHTTGSFHFMHINSQCPISPHSYAQITADAINVAMSTR